MRKHAAGIAALLGMAILVSGAGMMREPLPRVDEQQPCEETSQCVAVRATCGRWVAVNKKNEADADAFYQHQRMLVRCMQPDVDHVPTVTCKKPTAPAGVSNCTFVEE